MDKMSSNNQQEQNREIPNVAATTSSSSVVVVDASSGSNNNDDLNTSIGSNRSLNNRIFPSFRISRDIILNNVSHVCKLSMTHSFQCYLISKYLQVFQEIRPLVQNSSSSNAPFASWMRSSLQSVNLPPSDEHSTNSPGDNNASSRAQEVTTATDTSSVIINIGSPSTSYARQNSAPARTNTEITNDETMGSASTNESRVSLHHNEAGSGGDEPNNSNNAGGDANADNLAQMPEARALINTISRYFPYVCILFAKSCYDHLDGILDIFALFIVFAHSNFTIKQEITKQAQRRFLYLIRELIYIILVITIIAFLLEKKDNSTISLFFAPLNIPPEKKELALKDLLFSVVITDLILKLVTVFIKILFTMLPRRAVEFKNRVSKFIHFIN